MKRLRASAGDEPAVRTGGRGRYGRDWLIASGSLIPLIGVVFPWYLAWRDSRRGWMGVCCLLFLAAVACIPLSEAGDSIDGAAISGVWLATIAAAIVLAGTVSAESRRATRAELATRRQVSRRRRTLAAARVDPEDQRPGGGTALTEPVVVIEGVHRTTYALANRDGHPLGRIQPAGDCPPAYRARYELLGRDGSGILILHVAARRGGHADVVLAADQTELVRLEPAGTDDEPPHGRRRPFGRLGFGPRWLIAGGERIGGVQACRQGQLPMRVITDAHGDRVARVVRMRGGAGPMGTDRTFVADVGDAADERMRAAALFLGVLWDWYIVSWDAEGG